jgi:hypothetical protein
VLEAAQRRRRIDKRRWELGGMRTKRSRPPGLWVRRSNYAHQPSFLLLFISTYLYYYYLTKRGKYRGRVAGPRHPLGPSRRIRPTNDGIHPIADRFGSQLLPVHQGAREASRTRSCPSGVANTPSSPSPSLSGNRSHGPRQALPPSAVAGRSAAPS